MKENSESFRAARRRLLRIMGIGVAGGASAAIAANRVFAKQFVCEATHVALPKMVYDPEMQVMVDPDTRQPIYEDAKTITVASGLPTVTSGCADCPKKDDDGS